MPLPDLLTILKVATRATEGLRAIRPRQESHDSRVQDGVSRFLRTLYFAPDGILSLLKDVAKGERLTGARTRQALIDFNDRQWKIEGAIDGLEFSKLEKELGLSLNSIFVLGSVRDGKSDLRWAIQQEVNSYGQEGTSPNRARVRKLVKAIEELNAAIEQVEVAINRRAPLGPLQMRLAQKAALRKRVSRKKTAVSKKRSKADKDANVE